MGEAKRERGKGGGKEEGDLLRANLRSDFKRQAYNSEAVTSI